MKAFDWFFESDFMPHGHCFYWTPSVLWLHVISDILIALAYYSIPLTLVYFVRRRKDLAFGWIFLMFGAFICACGTTHLVDAWNIWHAHYRIEGLVKLGTAMISLTTAVALVTLIPKALALPTTADLAEKNRQLEEEIAQRRRIEDQSRQLIEMMPDAIVIVDASGRIVLVNRQAEFLFGYDKEEMLGEAVEMLIPEALRERHVDHRVQYGKKPRLRPMGRDLELHALRKDGMEVPVAVSLGPIQTAGGMRIISSIRDISEQARAEADLMRAHHELRLAHDGLEVRVAERTGELAHANRELLREVTEHKRAEENLRKNRDELNDLHLQLNAILRSTHHGLCMLDPGWKVMWLNRAMGRILNPDAGDTSAMVGASFESFIQSAAHSDTFHQGIILAIRLQGYFRHEIRLNHGTADARWYDVSIVRLDPGQTRSGYVASVTDITERKVAEDQLRYFATHDPLTGLPNRKMFMDTVREYFREATWNPGQGIAALLYIDLDGFKPVNDRYGHEAGDLLLVSVGRRIEKSLPKGSLAARIGGDEFGVLLRGQENAARIDQIAADLRARLGEPFHLDKSEVQITASIGVARAQGQFVDVDKLLSEADMAMYTAKRKDVI